MLQKKNSTNTKYWKDKIQQISDIEDDFYEAAFLQLKGKPENEDLYIAVEGRKESYVRGAK